MCISAVPLVSYSQKISLKDVIAASVGMQGPKHTGLFLASTHKSSHFRHHESVHCKLGDIVYDNSLFHSCVKNVATLSALYCHALLLRVRDWLMHVV